MSDFLFGSTIVIFSTIIVIVYSHDLLQSVLSFDGQDSWMIGRSIATIPLETNHCRKSLRSWKMSAQAETKASPLRIPLATETTQCKEASNSSRKHLASSCPVAQAQPRSWWFAWPQWQQSTHSTSVSRDCTCKIKVLVTSIFRGIVIKIPGVDLSGPGLSDQGSIVLNWILASVSIRAHTGTSAKRGMRSSSKLTCLLPLQTLCLRVVLQVAWCLPIGRVCH